MKKNSVLVLIESGEHEGLAAVSREGLSAGRRLAEILDTGLCACVLGHAVEEAARELGHYRLDTIITVNHPRLEHCHPDFTLAALLTVCTDVEPGAILMGQTLLSLDLAPRLACALDAGLVTDCVGIEGDTRQVEFIKPVYSGNILARLAFTSGPYVATLRPRAFEGAPRQEETTGKIIALSPELDAALEQTTVIERVTDQDQGPALGEADIVVAGGRGMGGQEGFRQITQLAGLLNGAVGASRPPCDLGWVPPSSQVGQTGEIVAPSLYIAVGISGSTQHIAGMAGARTVIAINKDPRANIFKIADFGVVGDYTEVLPAFTQGLEDMLGPGMREVKP